MKKTGLLRLPVDTINNFIRLTVINSSQLRRAREKIKNSKSLKKSTNNLLEYMKDPKNIKRTTDALTKTSDPYQEFIKKESQTVKNTNKTITDAYINGRKIVLIYQMGKVGSTSYASALTRSKKLQVFHVHRMLPISNYQMIRNFLSKEQVDQALRERTWMELYDKIILEHKPVYIITAVRDPISRNISAFFENIKNYYSFDEEITIEKAIHSFIRKYKHSVPIEWFYDQMKKALKINVFNYSFDVERGYDHIIHENIKVLILKSELDNRIKEEAIKNFLSLDSLKINNENITPQKINNIRYNDFKRRIVLSPNYLEEMLNTEMVKHFYSQEMIDQIRDKWFRDEVNLDCTKV